MSRVSSEATAKNLVVDSGSNGHVSVNKKWFKYLKRIDTSVTNRDGDDMKVLGIGEIEILAKDVHGRTKSLCLLKALFMPGYQKILSKKSV